MAADRALAEDHQAAGHDVGAFHRDGNRRRLPATAEVILRAQDDTLAAMDIHRVAGDFARHLGAVILRDRRRHRRLFAAIHGGSRRLRQCRHRIGVAGNARERFFNALEAADGQAELLADARVRTGHHGSELGRAAGGGGQGDGTADGQALDQHAPAVAHVVFAADQLRQRDEDILAVDRAVLEYAVEREVTASDVHAGGIARHQCERDAAVLLVAEQAIRVVQAEGDADDGRDRRQRDVALFEIHAHAHHARAVPVAFANDAVIGNRRGVGTRGRAGQPETRNLAAVGQARQVIVFLFLGAVVGEQFTRAERVRHADGRA